MAFCKAAALKDITSEKELKVQNGIDYGKLVKQAEYKAMLEEGWDWYA